MISRANELPDEASDFLIWNVAWRHRTILLLATVVGVLLGYLYTTQATRVYESSAQVLINRRNVEFPADGAASRFDHEALMSDKFLATQMMVIRSPVVVGRAVQVQQLARLRSFAGDSDPTAPIIGGLEIVRGTKAAREADVLTVRYRGLDPEDCQTVLQSIMGSYRDFLGESYKGFSDEAIRLMTRAKDELHAQLTERETAYLEFRKGARLHWSENSHEAESVPATRLAPLEEERAQIRVRRAQIEAHIATIEEAITKGTDRASLLMLVDRMEDASGLSDRTRTLDLETQLVSLQAEEQLLLNEFGPDFPLVKEVRGKIAAWRKFLDNGRSTESVSGLPDARSENFLPFYLESRRQELQGLQQLENRLTEAYERERQAAQEAMIDVLQDQTYRSEITRTQKLFDQALQSLQTITLLRGSSGYTVQVIWPPGPGAQVEPRVPLILAIAGMMGLCAGFGIAYLRYLGDKGFHSPQEIQDYLGLPVLSHIPHLARSRTVPSGEAARRNGKDSAVLFAVDRPASPEAEACYAIRTDLCRHHRRHGQRVFQITGPDSGAGTTTLAGNLSAVMALLPQRVLLIDANFRRPAVHRLLGIENGVGLSQLLANGGHLDADELALTRVENLWALPSGPAPSNPAELLTSRALEILVKTARDEFDFVIIDSPPVLGVTDACAIAQHVDGVLLTVRLTKQARVQAQEAVETLSRSGAKLIGTVINDVRRRSDYRPSVTTRIWNGERVSLLPQTQDGIDPRI